MMTILLIGAATVLSAPSAAPHLATSTTSVAVLTHAVEKGQMLSAGDFELVAPSPAARHGLSPADAAGLEAARRLRPGVAVQAADLVRPRLIHRGEMVTVRYAAGPLLITTSGRALADAGQGEALRVLNLSTNRTIEAVADKPGQVLLSH